MSIVVSFLTTEWSQDNESSCLGLIWHVWEVFIRDNVGFSCVLFSIYPCSDTNRKSSAVTHLVVSSHCLLICWPVWSHCYLVLALFVFSIDLSALHFDYKVFNITIKRNNTECQHSGAQRLAALTESTASLTLTCIYAIPSFSATKLFFSCAIN